MSPTGTKSAQNEAGNLPCYRSLTITYQEAPDTRQRSVVEHTKSMEVTVVPPTEVQTHVADVAVDTKSHPLPPMRYYQARSGWQILDLGELWRFRELIWAFGFRDLKVRYRQTVVGLAWALIQPLMTVVVFGILISWLHGTASDGHVPYVVTSLCGMVPWQFFAAATSQATLSIALNSNLIKKVYFPRVILPLSAFVPASVDFLVAFGMLAAVMAFYGIFPGWGVMFLPLLMITTVAVSFTFALWLSALNGIYRDVQFAVPFALQLGMMICPVVYETSAVVPDQWQGLYYLNPMAGLLQCYRAALLGSSMPAIGSLALSAFAMFVLLITGMAYFRRMERFFADVA